MFAGTSGIAFFATTGHMYSGPLRASEGAQGLWPCWKQRKNGKFLPISAIEYSDEGDQEPELIVISVPGLK